MLIHNYFNKSNSISRMYITQKPSIQFLYLKKEETVRNLITGVESRGCHTDTYIYFFLYFLVELSDRAMTNIFIAVFACVHVHALQALNLNSIKCQLITNRFLCHTINILYKTNLQIKLYLFKFPIRHFHILIIKGMLIFI